MAVLPNGRRQKVDFFSQRGPLLTANATQLGLNSTTVTAFLAKVTTAENDAKDMDSLRDAAKSATTRFYGSADIAIDEGREIIRTIKAFAASQADPNAVLALADIPRDQPPVPHTAPPAPGDISGSITTDGVLTVRWNAAESGQSNGIVFLVHRKVPGSEWRMIGATFTKSYIDTTFDPASPTTYKVQAQRGAFSSPFSPTLGVDLGIGGAGFTVSKMAA